MAETRRRITDTSDPIQIAINEIELLRKELSNLSHRIDIDELSMTSITRDVGELKSDFDKLQNTLTSIEGILREADKALALQEKDAVHGKDKFDDLKKIVGEQQKEIESISKESTKTSVMLSAAIAVGAIVVQKFLDL